MFIPASAYELWPRAVAAVSPLYETKKHFLVYKSAVLNYLMNPSIEAVTHIKGLITVLALLAFPEEAACPAGFYPPAMTES